MHSANSQGAFHVKPMPKVPQALIFCMPGIFREREGTKESEYSKSVDFKKLSILAQILSFLYKNYQKKLLKDHG